MTKTIETRVGLPDAPSALLRIALQDLEACERDPKYKIQMSTWLSTTGDGVCHVCLAGTVMAQTLGLRAGEDELVCPMDLDLSVARKLRAIDQFRQGEVKRGLYAMGISPPEGLPLNTPQFLYEYEESPVMFKVYVKTLASTLEGYGL